MIRFVNPEIAYLFIPWFLLLLWAILWSYRTARRFHFLGDKRVRWYVLGRVRPGSQYLKTFLLYIALGLVIFAATGPQIGTRIVELERQGVDVLFVLDTSTSMDAEDVQPSRLEKAKYETGRIIAGLQGDRVGMIVFAGTAHLHFPLTSDYAAARLFLNAVDTRLVQVQGTVLSEALQLAGDTFDPETRKYQTMVVLSDGEDHDGRAVGIAYEAAAAGIVIHTVGIGTQSGAPIPVGDGRDFKRDREGRIVTSIMNESILREVALAGRGTYTRVDNQSGNLQPLLDDILSMEKRTLKTQEFSQFEHRYQVFLLPAFLLLLLELILPGGKKTVPKVRSRYV